MMVELNPVSPASRRCLVILPAYNESSSIGPLMAQLSHRDLDVVVIDDGSTDGTGCHVHPPARLVHLPFNLGIGGAMQAGYRFAQLNGYDMAVQVDADGQHPPEEIQRLTDYLRESGADMVIGSRFLTPGYRQGLARRTGSWVLGLLIRGLTGQCITDCTSGFRAVNRRVIDAFASWYPDDYPEPQVVALLRRSGYRVVEIPIRMEPRSGGQTSIPLSRGLFYVVKVATCLVLDMMRQPWPNRKDAP